MWNFKVYLSIPHNISYPYIERCRFYSLVKIQELLDSIAHKCFCQVQQGTKLLTEPILKKCQLDPQAAISGGQNQRNPYLVPSHARNILIRFWLSTEKHRFPWCLFYFQWGVDSSYTVLCNLLSITDHDDIISCALYMWGGVHYTWCTISCYLSIIWPSFLS